MTEFIGIHKRFQNLLQEVEDTMGKPFRESLEDAADEVRYDAEEDSWNDGYESAVNDL